MVYYVVWDLVFFMKQHKLKPVFFLPSSVSRRHHKRQAHLQPQVVGGNTIMVASDSRVRDAGLGSDAQKN